MNDLYKREFYLFDREIFKNIFAKNLKLNLSGTETCDKLMFLLVT